MMRRDDLNKMVMLSWRYYSNGFASKAYSSDPDFVRGYESLLAQAEELKKQLLRTGRIDTAGLPVDDGSGSSDYPVTVLSSPFADVIVWVTPTCGVPLSDPSDALYFLERLCSWLPFAKEN